MSQWCAWRGRQTEIKIVHEIEWKYYEMSAVISYFEESGSKPFVDINYGMPF